MKVKIDDFFNNKTSISLSVMLLLSLNFIVRIVIYFNTKLFFFHDYKAYLKGVDLIASNGSIPLKLGNFLYLNSYIGYFFKYVLGSIHYYYIFNSFLAVLASFIVYKTVLLLTNNNHKVGLITLFLHLIYTEFLCWSSIFYTPILVIFLLSSVIFLCIYLIKSKNILVSLFTIFLMIIIINFSYFFKSEMSHFYFLFIVFGIINIRKKEVFFKFMLLGILLYTTTLTLRKNNVFPRNKGTIISVNDFNFFGHTLYGGDGGDGSFIYKENENRYYQELDKYCITNNVPDSLKHSRKIRNEFQSSEIRKFVTEHPFLWVKLQGYKFFRFFGVVPEGDSAKILITGMFEDNMYLTAIFLVLPFSLMILLILFFSDIKIVVSGLKNPNYLLMFLMVGYYILGSVFYGQYQERYRMPLMVCFLLPYLGYLINSFKLDTFSYKKKLINIVAVFLVLVIWSNQLYNVVVTKKERYMNTIERVKK